MLDQYRSLIDELLETPTAVREALGHLDGDDQNKALLLVSALHSRDQALLERMERIRKASSAHLEELPSVDSAIAESELPADLDVFLENFDTTRGNVVSMLMNLTLSGWSKRATHDEGGTVELGDEVEDHVEFDEAIRVRLDALG